MIADMHTYIHRYLFIHHRYSDSRVTGDTGNTGDTRLIQSIDAANMTYHIARLGSLGKH